MVEELKKLSIKSMEKIKIQKKKEIYQIFTKNINNNVKNISEKG